MLPTGATFTVTVNREYNSARQLNTPFVKSTPNTDSYAEYRKILKAPLQGACMSDSRQGISTKGTTGVLCRKSAYKMI
jgi:hypothetical protein